MSERITFSIPLVDNHINIHHAIQASDLVKCVVSTAAPVLVIANLESESETIMHSKAVSMPGIIAAL